MSKSVKGKLSRAAARKERAQGKSAQGKKKRKAVEAVTPEVLPPPTETAPVTADITAEAPAEVPAIAVLEEKVHAPSDVLARLAELIRSKRSAPPATSHAARLLQRGTPYVAQKLGEEAVECVIELLGGDKAAIVSESADVLYHLVAAWVATDVDGEAVLSELDRRMRASERRGSEPLPSRHVRRATVGTTKVP